MKARRKTFPAIARLSRAAREIMERAFIEGSGVRSVQSIVDEIGEKTGETIDDNAVHRYREFWLTVERPFIEARKEAEGMISAIKDNPTADAEELVKQRLTVAQLLTAKRFEESSPVELGYLDAAQKRIEVQRERNKIMRERAGNDQKKIELLERTLALKEKQIERAVGKADAEESKVKEIAKKKGLDAETLKKIREEVYGIVEAQA